VSNDQILLIYENLTKLHTVLYFIFFELTIMKKCHLKFKRFGHITTTRRYDC